MHKIGWMGKLDYDFFSDNLKGKYPKQGHDITVMGTMYKTKGKKDDWNENDWPPVKVKISIEVV